jgi:hypothetical protein
MGYRENIGFISIYFTHLWIWNDLDVSEDGIYHQIHGNFTWEFKINPWDFGVILPYVCRPANPDL